jgi:hypothetical protein
VIRRIVLGSVEAKGVKCRRSMIARCPRAATAMNDAGALLRVLSACGREDDGKVRSAGRGGEMKTTQAAAPQLTAPGRPGTKRRLAGGARKREGAMGAESLTCAPCSSGAFRQRETNGYFGLRHGSGALRSAFDSCINRFAFGGTGWRC